MYIVLKLLNGSFQILTILENQSYYNLYYCILAFPQKELKKTFLTSWLFGQTDGQKYL